MSTSPVTIHLLLFVGLVQLMVLEGDFIGSDGGLSSIGRAGDDTFATSSFNLFDFKLGLEILGITYLSVALFDVDGCVCSGKLVALVILTGSLSLAFLLASGRWTALFCSKLEASYFRVATDLHHRLYSTFSRDYPNSLDLVASADPVRSDGAATGKVALLECRTAFQLS